MSRQFTEAEAQRIFAHMAEMQRADAARPSSALSLEDLQEAARAAGLDPRYVTRAVAELDAAPAQTRTLLSAPVEVVRQRVVPGPLTDETWASMVNAARAHFGDAGFAGQIGSLREWTLHTGTNNGNRTVTRLSAEPTEGGIRLMLTQSIRETIKGFSIATAIVSAMLVIFGAMAVAGVDPELWVAVGIMAVMALGFGGGSQVWARWWAANRSGQFDSVLDRLELVARSSEAETGSEITAEATHAPNAPLLDLDRLGDAPEAEAPGTERRRERS
ncbi:MAG: hypothetical protein AAGI52_11775 [Bacteroidota bacterium]